MRRSPHRDIKAIARTGHEESPPVEIIKRIDQLGVGTGRLRTHVGLRADRAEDEPEEIRLFNGERDVRATQTREARTRRLVRVTRMRGEDTRHAFVERREPALPDGGEQSVLVGEVVVGRTRGDIEGLGYGSERHMIGTVLPDGA